MRDVNRVGVLTDTTASIPLALAKELQIDLVPYYEHRGLDALRDRVDVQPEPFARYLTQADRLGAPVYDHVPAPRAAAEALARTLDEAR